MRRVEVGRGGVRRAAPWLRGPVGAPDGFGLLLGGFSMSLPRSVATGSTTFVDDSTPYSIDAAHTSGFLFSTSVERRFLAFAFETRWGYTSFHGTVSPAQGAAGPFAMTGNLLQWGVRLRVGARLPLGNVALAAGSGLGAGMWIVNRATIDPTPGNVTSMQGNTPQGVHGVWSVPFWASATLKPSCGWGLQAIASYDVQPTNGEGDALFLGAGLLWQPSASCAEPASIEVTP